MLRTRLFTARIVVLPRLDANGACALGHSILSAAGEVKLNPSCAEAVEEVSGTLLILERVTSDATIDSKLAAAPDAKAADHRVDVAWGCLYDFALVWTRVENAAHGPIAQTILDIVFPDGTRFLNLPYRQEWIQSRLRLKLIEDNKLAEKIDAIGGAAILKAIEDAHQNYGDVLGLTAAVTPDPQDITLRDAMTNFMDAVRNYVVQATAMQRKTKPETLEISKKLLHPIVITESRAKGASTATDDPQPTDEGSGDQGTVTTTAPAPSISPPPVPQPSPPPATTPSS